MKVSFEKAAPAAGQPVIDVASTTEVIKTPTETPVAGVAVESVTTVAPAAAPATVAPPAAAPAAAPATVAATPTAPAATEPAPTAPPAAPPAPASAPANVDTAPAASIPTAPATPVAAMTVTPSAVATVPKQDVPATAVNPAGIDDENIGFEDVILPRINIVQKVGDLSNIFNSGEIVLNQQIVIHEPAFIHPSEPAQNTPGTGLLTFTIIGFRRRQYTEKVEGGKMGLLLNNETEIAKHNGTLDYKEWKQSVDASKVPGGPAAKKLFYKLATAFLLVERPGHIPDADHVLFPYESGGKFYALALWSMKGTSYTNAAKHFFTARKIGHLRTGYTAQAWTLTTKLEEYSGNFSYIPVIKPGLKNTDEFRQFAKEILGAGN